jgi:uncharacterized protein (DUF427 family)
MVILFNTARVSGTQGANKVWKYRGQKRPPFAETPEAGQESVWDYPRPPAIVVDQRRVEVRLGNLIIADSRQNYRILETASPPTFYIPPHGIRLQLLEAFPGTSVCEWKGVAQYWGLKNCSGSLQAIGWSYPSPAPPFEAIANYFSFYPGRVECYVEGEAVRPQAGEFYGGWITSEIVGPFKGSGDTRHW